MRLKRTFQAFQPLFAHNDSVYQPEPPPPAPDKKAIADAIKGGAEIPGVHIEHRQSLQIK